MPHCNADELRVRRLRLDDQFADLKRDKLRGDKLATPGEIAPMNRFVCAAPVSPQGYRRDCPITPLCHSARSTHPAAEPWTRGTLDRASAVELVHKDQGLRDARRQISRVLGGLRRAPRQIIKILTSGLAVMYQRG